MALIMTQVFNSYDDFLNREDKKINGVDKNFALNNPLFLDENTTNQGCWNCIGCSDCIDSISCRDSRLLRGCSGCSGCSRCSRCRGYGSCKFLWL